MIPPIKQVIVFLVGWMGFKIVAYSIQFSILLFGKAGGFDGTKILYQNSTSMIINSLCYISMLIALVLIINTNIIKLLKSFAHWQSYLAGAIAFLAIYAFSISSAIPDGMTMDPTLVKSTGCKSSILAGMNPRLATNISCSPSSPII